MRSVTKLGHASTSCYTGNIIKTHLSVATPGVICLAAGISTSATTVPVPMRAPYALSMPPIKGSDQNSRSQVLAIQSRYHRSF